MIGRLASAALKARFAVWVLSSVAVPRRSRLRRRFHSGMMGVVLATASGVLLALFLAAILAAAGAYLTLDAGLSPWAAFGVIIAITLALTAQLYIAARAAMRRVVAPPTPLEKEAEEKEEPVWSQVINGFLNGLLTSATDPWADKPLRPSRPRAFRPFPHAMRRKGNGAYHRNH